MTTRVLNPDYIKGVKRVLKAAPYFHLISLEMESLEPGRAELRIPTSDKHMNPFDRVHGSVGAALIDAATFWAIYSQVEDGKAMTTAELKLNYLSAGAPGKTLAAVGEAIKVGKTLGLAEARLVEVETGRLVAFGTATCMILDFPPPRALAELPAKFL